MATIANPLYCLLKKDCAWNWTELQQESFTKLKNKLITTPVLIVYDKLLPLKLTCDASSYGVGAVSSHVLPDNSERPIAFASRTLNEHEKRYSQLDKECVSIIFGLKKFNQYVFGRKFTLSTDNKALKHIFVPCTSLSNIAASRLVRWSIILCSYDYDIEYKPRKAHGNADMLSRFPSKDTTQISSENLLYSYQIGSLPVSAEKILLETEKDAILQNVARLLKSGNWEEVSTPDFKPFYGERHELSLGNGIILWGLKVVIPKSLQNTIIHELHHQHPGIVRMKALSRIHVWFPGIDKKISRS